MLNLLLLHNEEYTFAFMIHDNDLFVSQMIHPALSKRKSPEKVNTSTFPGDFVQAGIHPGILGENQPLSIFTMPQRLRLKKLLSLQAPVI